ncbi:heat shock protein Hsp15 [Roseovarius nanhaiticus]|uniref:Heat shock protein Hsp15 n=1 Tax=Roseovarius nanhaiticus TaxID=573024 RepID=A0A1N7HCZ4_9RHOB|nr:RNA-binding S4 domain-containing protein [Roseovarius nanhaiticus]SEL01806.1 heat shock protein Hsp15 [Roseovarius nanhaiticus]SIS22759.1 heat shock protein Hsp15 [Roseovarius nanhaiticus]
MSAVAEAEDAPDQGKIRLDKWLWHARFFKTRGLAAGVVKSGHVRVNGNRAGKAAHAVRSGDVLTFSQADTVRVVRILALGTRRGPAPEAQALYDDLTPPPVKSETPVSPNPRYEGKGRPTKKDRRKLDLNRPGALE